MKIQNHSTEIKETYLQSIFFNSGILQKKDVPESSELLDEIESEEDFLSFFPDLSSLFSSSQSSQTNLKYSSTRED